MENQNTHPKARMSFKQVIKYIIDEYFKYPIYLMTHPIAGWYEFKREKKGKLSVALVYLALMTFNVILQNVSTGFLSGGKGGKDFNLLLTISLVVLPVIVGTVANWCITTLFNGKGTMIDIFKMICYSFFPSVWLGIFTTIFSNFIIQDEMIYVTFFQALATGLTIYILFFGLRGIHEYGLFGNIVMIIATIVSVAVILFLALLFVSIIQQMWGWVYAITNEIKMRYF